jgi:ABC-2 type transport system ATP-binding protein
MSVDKGTALIEARNLSVRFGKISALDGLDLVVASGQVLAILGPNGAGKTTFVRALSTLVRPTSGDLRVRGNDVVRHAVAVRRDIGLAGQFAAVEPTMTGRENLEMTGRLFGHRRHAARRAASIAIDQLGLGDVADRRCSSYSGGQRRRLDVGASLVGAPRLLLLDEPTTGLDPAGRREVWDVVRALVGGGTDVVLTTHYLEEANELADQIVVIDHGKTIASGSIGDLKASAGGDVIDVVVADFSRLGAAGEILERVTLNTSRFDHNGGHVSVASARGVNDLALVIRLLDESAIAVDEIGVRRPTLDEVFLMLTGEKQQSEREEVGSNR